MIRRFNFTGRRRITRDRISITLTVKNGRAENFKATLDMEDLDGPEFENARVLVDACHRIDVKRYDFGAVKNLIHPNTDLDFLKDCGENLRFRVLVVDPSSRRILASAEKIRPMRVGGRPLLDVYFVDLGQRAWKLEFVGDGAPRLLVNKCIPKHFPTSQPEFITYILPAVLQQILSHIIFVDEIGDIEEDDTDWRNEWLDFAKLYSREEVPILDKEDEHFDEDEVESWIEDVVEDFCASKTGDAWREFLRIISGEEAD